MALAPLDFIKTKSDQRVTVAFGPANAVANVNAPAAAELNAMFNVSPALSWQDWDFGIQASETVNEPSFADAANFTEAGAAQYGGSASMFDPKNYDDASNALSLAYDLTDTPWTLMLVAIRIDGDKKNSTPFVDGDYVHVFLAMTDGETNSIQGADALRRTVSLLQQSVFAVYTIVGSLAALPVPAATTLAVTAGKSKRIPVKVLGREFTNACEFTSSAPAIAKAGRGGIITGVAAGTASVTITNPYTGTQATVAVTVS